MDLAGRRFGTLRVREHFDWPLFLGVTALAIIGVVNLYSATSPYIDKSGLADIYVSQVYRLVLGGMAAILVTLIDYRNFERLAYVLYFAGLGLLVLVFVLAADIRGSSRWIELGNLTIQPSEFMKILLILAVARYLSEDPKTEARRFVDLAPPVMIAVVPSVMVMLQPDFGTSMIYTLTVFTMLAMTRIHVRTLVSTVVAVGVAIPVFWRYLLLDYQRARITSFLDPEANRTDAGWHAFQSRTAIGNGGMWGDGFREGTQNQFGFLPDQYSDFPFSVFAEEWGFVGVVFLLALYAFLCVWSVRIASLAKDRFGAQLAIGVGALFFWHTFFNIGMAIGVLPVVGITLPLFSYGGSSVVTSLIGFGMLMNVSIRR